MEDFEKCIQKCELEDIRHSGRVFIWTNKRLGEDFVAKKLDRVLGNWNCFDSTSHLSAHFPTLGISDHSPVVIHFQNQDHSFGRNFKYLNIWGSHPSFLSVVKEALLAELLGRQGTPLENVSHKLKRVKQGLKELHRKFFKDVSSSSTREREALDKIQSLLCPNPLNVELRGREQEATLDVKEADRLEE
ncbi:hypothetical protein CFOL_v3_05010 [Cephalotus follicularis]|uniref:Exo_endo_phos domain-containing protein n=1 Tax=Cephalotus follicularis TaxID=3775 RepID=A0A1Q3B0Z4_CEPFO|nr:hypothetical protein CFOL_v3_05010 [Cephalotus follicularis]